MEIKPLDDVMFYYGKAFFTYIILFIIVLFNFCKALYIRRSELHDKPIVRFILISDLFADILCGLAMGGGMYFHGVLADNNALGIHSWIDRLNIISLISLIIFVLNVFVVFRKRK